MQIGEKFLDWSDEDPSLDEILTSVTLYHLTDSFATSIYTYRDVRFTSLSLFPFGFLRSVPCHCPVLTPAPPVQLVSESGRPDKWVRPSPTPLPIFSALTQDYSIILAVHYPAYRLLELRKRDPSRAAKLGGDLLQPQILQVPR